MRDLEPTLMFHKVLFNFSITNSALTTDGTYEGEVAVEEQLDGEVVAVVDVAVFSLAQHVPRVKVTVAVLEMDTMSTQ